jgi:hypothetical protein
MPLPGSSAQSDNYKVSGATRSNLSFIDRGAATDRDSTTRNCRSSLSTEDSPICDAFDYCLLCAVTLPLLASTPDNGTLTPPVRGIQTSSVNWSGGPYTGVTADPSACTSVTCDSYALTVNVPPTFYSSNPNYTIQVGINYGKQY